MIDIIIDFDLDLAWKDAVCGYLYIITALRTIFLLVRALIIVFCLVAIGPRISFVICLYFFVHLIINKELTIKNLIDSFLCYE